MPNKALRLTVGQANKMNKNLIIPKDLLREYTAGRSKKKGVELEYQVRELCYFLDKVYSAWVTAPGSELDQGLKADVVLEVKEGREVVCLAIQVKTTKEQAREHLALGTVSGGRFPVPGVVFKASPMVMLRQLRLVTEVPFSGNTKRLIKMAKVYRGKTVPYEVFRGMDRTNYVKLGLATPMKDGLRFN